MSTLAIPLLHGRQLLVNELDAALFVGRPWHAIPARSTFYAQAGDDTSVLAHRLVMAPGQGVLVDHVNRNGLDNRRANLRLCNQSQNKANRPAPVSNTSGYKGVSKTSTGRYAAYITVDYRRTHLGTFADPWDAAQAYNEAALAAWGEFAALNVYRPQAARDGGQGCPGTAGGGPA